MIHDIDALAAKARTSRAPTDPASEARTVPYRSTTDALFITDYEAEKLGGHDRAAQLQADGQARFFKDRFHRQIGIIRARRSAGTDNPDLAATLRLYLKQWRAWRNEALRLAAAARTEAALNAFLNAAE